jgi:phosphonate transport system substrate-binding protein
MEERTPVKHLRLPVALTALLLLAVACTGGGTASSAADESEPAASEAAEMPEELVIGFVPSREADALVETIQPVADALSEELGIPVEGIVSTDYTALVTAMETGSAAPPTTPSL